MKTGIIQSAEGNRILAELAPLGIEIFTPQQSSGRFMWMTDPRHPGRCVVCDVTDQSTRLVELQPSGRILVLDGTNRLLEDHDGLLAEMIRKQAPSTQAHSN